MILLPPYYAPADLMACIQWDRWLMVLERVLSDDYAAYIPLCL